jgi:hypothetical protein
MSTTQTFQATDVTGIELRPDLYAAETVERRTNGEERHELRPLLLLADGSHVLPAATAHDPDSNRGIAMNCPRRPSRSCFCES